jgi:pimeloyl-ACP methyl ester carboxylesterase
VARVVQRAGVLMHGASRRSAQVEIAGHRLEILPSHPPVPGAPWVVYLHEGLGSAGQWRDFPARVSAGTGAGAIAYSRWGYGGSDGRPAPWPDDFLADEARTVLPAVLEHAGIRKPVVYGHSDGATIALMFAAAFPEACAGVISVAAHVMLEELSFESIARARQRFIEGPLREALARQHGAHVDDTLFGWADTWLRPRVRAWDMRASLGAITCPVLVIQGRDDEFGTLAQVDAIAQGVGGPVETLVLDHCGHVPHREKRREVLEAVTRFIRHLSRK